MLGFRCFHKEECQESIKNFECLQILVWNLILDLILVLNLILESDFISST